jgi:predicted outer membrane repeat protein
MGVTFSNNYTTQSSSLGGGMYNYRSNPSVTNVTFSNNSANSGGGIYNDDFSIPILTNVTCSGNSASVSGGGMYNTSNYGKPTLTNVIIANNTVGGDCFGALDPSSSNNLIKDSAHACGLTHDSNDNIIGFDPNLGPLTDFVGPGKQLFPLLTGSPAIDAGTAINAPSTDQRDITRPQGKAFDIGSYEEKDFPWPMFLPAITKGVQ